MLDAAAAVFAERGLEAGVAEIAQRAGVGTATVFRRFPTKQDLIVAVVDARICDMGDQLDAAQADPDPWAGVVRALEAVARTQARDRGLFEAIGSAVSGDEHLHARHVELMGRLEAIVEAAKAAGVLREDVAATDLPAARRRRGQLVPDRGRRRPGALAPVPRHHARRPAPGRGDAAAGRSAARSRRSSRPRPAVSDRAERVLERIRDIPPGFVRTYGDVSPGAPRFAGTVLSQTEDHEVPWFRVVRADGSLAKGARQRALLDAEGVPFRGDRVDLAVARLPT